MTARIDVKGGFKALVDDIDSDLAKYSRRPANSCRIENSAYAIRTTSRNGKTITARMHREIMERMIGRNLLSSESIDHIDRDPLNNTRRNLRIATGGQNRANSTVNKKSASGYKGVYKMKDCNRWSANIRVNKKAIYLGLFTSPQLAHQAYCEAAIKHHGEFARFK